MSEAVSGCFQHAGAATGPMGVFFILSRAMRVRRLCLSVCGQEKSSRVLLTVARATGVGLSDVGRTYAELNALGRCEFEL